MNPTNAFVLVLITESTSFFVSSIRFAESKARINDC